MTFRLGITQAGKFPTSCNLKKLPDFGTHVILSLRGPTLILRPSSFDLRNAGKIFYLPSSSFLFFSLFFLPSLSCFFPSFPLFFSSFSLLILIPECIKSGGNFCETLRKSNFLENGKMGILVKIQNFSRSLMMKRTSPLESSREI